MTAAPYAEHLEAARSLLAGRETMPPAAVGLADQVQAAQESQLRLELPGVVESVVKTRTNGPLIAAAAVLWIKPDDQVVDVTFGKGNFWTHYRPERLIAHDLHVGDGVDFRHLPEADRSVDVVVFDPPYIAPGGRETSTIPAFNDAYGLANAPRTVEGLNELIAAGITEAARVLKRRGVLMVKCMDSISSGRFVQGHHHVIACAMNAGLEQVDEFVHYSGLGPQPSGRRQVHSRHAHSFLCVFEGEAS